MAYVKNKKIMPCPICGEKAKRLRRHRSWVYCSNENCLLHTADDTGSKLGVHYSKWNETFRNLDNVRVLSRIHHNIARDIIEERRVLKEKIETLKDTIKCYEEKKKSKVRKVLDGLFK